MNPIQDFVNHAKQYIPKFNVAFKQDSAFMKFLSVIMFFNKKFMTEYITTIGNTVYLPSKESYEKEPEFWLDSVIHEFIHAMDYKKYSILFSLSYLLPQLLVMGSLLSLFAIWYSKLWLLSLWFLTFITPLPAYFRMKWELRGYTMDAALAYWREPRKMIVANDYVNMTLGPGYYFMWPFRKNMSNRFLSNFSEIYNGTILKDKTFKIVYDWAVSSGQIKAVY